jgi:subtilisin family serine protease
MQVPLVRRPARPALELLEPRTLLAVTPNDVLFPQEWWLQKVSVPDAWDFTTGSSKVVVNVNDSGIDYTHPDLYLNIWLNQKEIPFAIGNKGLRDTDADGLITFYDLNAKQGGKLVNGSFVNDVNANGYIDGGDLLNDPRWENGIDDGGNGYVDDLVGWDFHDDDNDPMDVQNHGTMCAGVVGTVGNNTEGGAGVNWRVQMMATKRTDDKGTTKPTEDYVAGIYYAADNGARVSNNSWQYSNPNATVTKLFTDAINYAGTKGLLYVAAAGNFKSDNDKSTGNQVFPASFDLPNIISVAASTQDDQLASFSNWGLTTVDLAAPGEGVGSTIPVAQGPAFPYLGGFAGTSVAAPFVAGAAALLLAHNPNLTYAQLKDAIISSVDPLPAFAGKTVSGGRLNIFRALAAVSAATAPATSTPPLFSTNPVSSHDDWLATPNAVLI